MSDGEWMVISLEEKMARRHGTPTQIPVPKADLEMLAEKGLQVEQARKWVSQFLTKAPSSFRVQNGALASKWDTFLAKATNWQRAEQAFSKNDWEGAISALSMVARIDRDDHAAKLNLAMAHANARQPDKALTRLEEIADTYEGDADYHVTRGQILASLGRKDDAVGQYVLALEAKPSCKPALDAMVKLGVLVPIYEDPKDAQSLNYVRSNSIADYVTSVWDSAERSRDYYLEQLAYHEGDGRYAIALSAAERALALDASCERAALARVVALRALGRLDEATTAADQWLADHPKSAAAHVEVAACRAAKGDRDAARALVDQALAIDPGDALALHMRFWPAKSDDLAQMAAALPALEDFVAAHEDSAGAQRSLARAYLAAARGEDALSRFAKAVKLAPEDDDLRGEWWTELGKQRRYQEVLADVANVGDIRQRAWSLRWSEAEAYAGLGKKMEAQGAFTAINLDEKLPVEVRKRAKRAVQSLAGG
jgi:predicted negative regulator of RcsB-dependent stress response